MPKTATHSKRIRARKTSMPAPEYPTRYKFTPEQFHQLGELGLLDDENRYELLEGDIYIMPPERTEHSVSKARTTQSFYSLETDRTKKLPIYARAGVQECWILNLSERVLEVYREPSKGRYKLARYYTPEEAVRPLFAPMWR